MYTLYGDDGTASFAPHALLVENDLRFELIDVDRSRGATHESDYLALCPAGYVPALRTPEGVVMYESAAICLYLGQRHGLTDVCPAAQEPDLPVFLRSLFYLTNTVQESYKIFYYPHRYTSDPAGADAVRIKGRELAMERWQVVDDHLRSNGPFHLGARYSIVDLYMAMLVDWYPERPDLLGRYKSVAACFEAVTGRAKIGDVLRRHGIISAE
ncbi:MAG: glutathione S-transferase [Rhodospirillales bacterium]